MSDRAFISPSFFVQFQFNLERQKLYFFISFSVEFKFFLYRSVERLTKMAENDRE